MEAGRCGGWRMRLPMYRLQRHPLRVKAHLAYSLVLRYALPVQQLAPMVPAGLKVDGWKGWGFVAIGMVQTRGLRPAGLPRAMGQNFFLAGYRIFTTFKVPEGTTRRGLYILRSDTNRRVMAVAGNLLTHYRYRVSEVTAEAGGGEVRVRIATRGGEADLEVRAEVAGEGGLPATSVFQTAAEARRFAGPLPYTFDHEEETNSIIAIKATRRQWEPRMVAVEVREATFLERGAFARTTPRLASAFYVEGTDYQWNRGVRYPLAEGCA